MEGITSELRGQVLGVSGGCSLTCTGISGAALTHGLEYPGLADWDG